MRSNLCHVHLALELRRQLLPRRCQPLAEPAPRRVELDEPVACGGAGGHLREVLKVGVAQDHHVRNRLLLGSVGALIGECPDGAGQEQEKGDAGARHGLAA